jgi:hypothetical protein
VRVVVLTVAVLCALTACKSIEVATASNGVTISITLDQERQFLVNSSQVPAELELAIG